MLLGSNFYARGTSSAISGDSASCGVLSLQQHHKATKESELVAIQVVVGVHEFCCGVLPSHLLWFCHLLLAALLPVGGFFVEGRRICVQEGCCDGDDGDGVGRSRSSGICDRTGCTNCGREGSCDGQALREHKNPNSTLFCAVFSAFSEPLQLVTSHEAIFFFGCWCRDGSTRRRISCCCATKWWWSTGSYRSRRWRFTRPACGSQG